MEDSQEDSSSNDLNPMQKVTDALKLHWNTNDEEEANAAVAPTRCSSNGTTTIESTAVTTTSCSINDTTTVESTAVAPASCSSNGTAMVDPTVVTPTSCSSNRSPTSSPVTLTPFTLLFPVILMPRLPLTLPTFLPAGTTLMVSDPSLINLGPSSPRPLNPPPVPSGKPTGASYCAKQNQPTKTPTIQPRSVRPASRQKLTPIPLSGHSGSVVKNIVLQPIFSAAIQQPARCSMPFNPQPMKTQVNPDLLSSASCVQSTTKPAALRPIAPRNDLMIPMDFRSHMYKFSKESVPTSSAPSKSSNFQQVELVNTTQLMTQQQVKPKVDPLRPASCVQSTTSPEPVRLVASRTGSINHITLRTQSYSEKNVPTSSAPSKLDIIQQQVGHQLKQPMTQQTNGNPSSSALCIQSGTSPVALRLIASGTGSIAQTSFRNHLEKHRCYSKKKSSVPSKSSNLQQQQVGHKLELLDNAQVDLSCFASCEHSNKKSLIALRPVANGTIQITLRNHLDNHQDYTKDYVSASSISPKSDHFQQQIDHKLEDDTQPMTHQVKPNAKDPSPASCALSKTTSITLRPMASGVGSINLMTFQNHTETHQNCSKNFLTESVPSNLDHLQHQVVHNNTQPMTQQPRLDPSSSASCVQSKTTPVALRPIHQISLRKHLEKHQNFSKDNVPTRSVPSKLNHLQQQVDHKLDYKCTVVLTRRKYIDMLGFLEVCRVSSSLRQLRSGITKQSRKAEDGHVPAGPPKKRKCPQNFKSVHAKNRSSPVVPNILKKLTKLPKVVLSNDLNIIMSNLLRK